ncbi:MAG: glycine betaine ABC transporter substrate-binding protein [Myxococcota bacterium]
MRGVGAAAALAARALLAGLAAGIACGGISTGAPTIRVGSKIFTEGVVLSECVTQLLAQTGLPVWHKEGLGGSRVLWDALLANEIDVYPEYLGTLREMLGITGTDGELDVLLRQRGIGRTESLGFSNSYGLAMRSQQARELGIRSISDLRRFPHLQPGFSPEFRHRQDCWPAIKSRYHLPHAPHQALEHELAYRTLRRGAVDLIDIYTTEPELADDWVTVLRDEKHVFPRYDAFLVYRNDLAKRSPTALAVLRRLENQITATRMIALNRTVTMHGESEQEAAQAFLTQLGLVTGGTSARFHPARVMLQRTKEHLELVLLSMLLAVATAVPLGLWAGKSRRAGRTVLGIAGILQTIPSLALLVFMIPVLGIGKLPAVAALYLYSLLPIVRSTAAGLSSIPLALRESAQVIGLGRWARLRLIELPLISRDVLTGIKTATVINIGTATLGALIGAGGYGQAILTGIRLNDTSQILQGAVPAALMALLAQWLFEQLDAVIVPRGLRLQAHGEEKGA